VDATWMAVIVVVAVVAVLAIGAMMYWAAQQKRERERSRELRRSFGPEYERAVRDSGSRKQAESELALRRQRVEALNIKPLSREDCDRFSESWMSTQAQFVDDPAGAVRDADRLVTEVMQTRGYPVGEFEQRAADISVDHADVVENYRRAHTIAQAQERGEASTEDLRQAMVCYRELFNDLLETGEERRKAG